MIDVKHNAFSQDLGSDFIAVDALGNILTRASTEDACRQAAPDAAAFYTGSDLTGPLEGAGTTRFYNAEGSVGAIVTDGAHTDYATGEIDPAVAVEAEQPIASGLEPDAPVEPEEPVVAEEPEETAPHSRKRKPAK